MKKYNGNIMIIGDDEHVVLTSKIILKRYFENIEALDSPKTLESKLKQQEYDVVLSLIYNLDPWISFGSS